jgi:hypothetical protein
MLSGDVHCSYLAEARLRREAHPDTGIHQLTMSPFRNPVPRHIRWANKLLTTRPMTAALRLLARRAGVGELGVDWRVTEGPWFDNGVMTLRFGAGSVAAEVEHARLESGQERLRTTAVVVLQ